MRGRFFRPMGRTVLLEINSVRKSWILSVKTRNTIKHVPETVTEGFHPDDADNMLSNKNIASLPVGFTFAQIGAFGLCGIRAELSALLKFKVMLEDGLIIGIEGPVGKQFTHSRSHRAAREVVLGNLVEMGEEILQNLFLTLIPLQKKTLFKKRIFMDGTTKFA